MQILDLFPTPIGVTQIKCDDSELEFLKSLPNSNIQDISNNGLNYDFVLKNKELKSLRECILKEANDFARNQLAIAGNLVFQQSWANNKTDGTGFHRHKNSLISGVYYFMEEEYSKIICFDKPDQNYQCYMMEPVFDENIFGNCRFTQTQVAIPPQQYLLLLFPSYLPHGVVPRDLNNPDGLHQSIAFNLVTEDVLGHRHRLNQFNYKVIEDAYI